MTDSDLEAAAAAMVGAELARERRNELTGLLAAHFTRREPVRQAGRYIDGLMSDLPEEDHEFGKDQFGCDHAQVRLYTPVMRHLTLVMAALAICAVTAASLRDTSPAPPLPVSADQEPPDDPGLIPFTVPEIKRLYILVHQTLHSIAHGLHWSRWKRRHQARARWYHHRAWLRDLETFP